MNVYAISHRRNALRALTDTALLERADELNRQLTEALANDGVEEDRNRIER